VQTERVYATDIELAPARALITRFGLERVHLLAPSELEREIQAQSLDYVITTDVLEHVPDLERTIAGFARLLRRGGRLVVSGPTETRLYRLGRVLAGFKGKEHYHHTNIAHIREQITSSGAFVLQRSRALPVPHLVEAFWIDRFERV
jgi:2-polyprenyl-3-methyl-5-hydroxy-6-metoxy-1,4-benzoquinol methylase